MRPSLIIAVGFAVSSILCGSAWAQANRTFVSGQGSDTNPCSLTGPCRSFAQAITQTNAGGEIAVLDTAGYGAVTIDKSISIVNEDGVEAGVTATTTDGIDISVGAGDVVNLRGLTLTEGGVGAFGINFNGLGTLNIQNCVVRGFEIGGIAFEPVGTAALTVSDTIVSGGTTFGIVVAPGGSGTVTATFNRVQVIGNGGAGFGINGATASGGTLDATITNSTASNNGTGIAGQSQSGAAATQVMVSNSVMSNNATGVEDAGLLSAIYLAKNTIAGNTTAFVIETSGSLFSFGDNDIKTNGNDGGTISTVATK